ncbi:hypothetical protein HELRODRAFT_166228 [Helobdella robusta]|uniref:Transporter n=1 Tax=Helobdella robusta TaxID=6412 RepID=T1EXX2_HELRO|nr:hypothetical protein HELRODRAFT_166228 [Helobdella robusta]ESN90548.1 hypothetical protein HELRODRAFT_166228 [Helobdella robusta]
MSDGIDHSGKIVWQLACCLFLAWVIIFLVLIRGISSLGKVVYFTSTFPYVLLTVMLVRGVTLHGALKGIKFYVLPDFTRLTDPIVWGDAATQIYFAFSVCIGVLIAMSSYNNFKNNTLRDAFIVPIVNVLTSFYAGFVIFSVLGFMADMKGVEVKDVAADGPGLVFVVYPEGLSTMPAAPVWSVLFFIMMMMLGFSSMFGMVECFFVSFLDEFPTLLRKSSERTYLFRGIGCTFFFVISLPMVTNGGFYLFSIIDSFAGSYPLLIVGLVEMIVLMFVYGFKNFRDDMEMMLGKKPVLFMLFRISWSFIGPIVIVLSIVAMGLSYNKPTLFNKKYSFPPVGEILGWLIVTFCISFIPLYFLFYMSSDLYRLYKDGIQPEPSWGPARVEDRTGRFEKTRHATVKSVNVEITTNVTCDDAAEDDKVKTDKTADAAEKVDTTPYSEGCYKNQYFTSNFVNCSYVEDSL